MVELHKTVQEEEHRRRIEDGDAMDEDIATPHSKVTLIVVLVVLFVCEVNERDGVNYLLLKFCMVTEVYHLIFIINFEHDVVRL